MSNDGDLSVYLATTLGSLLSDFGVPGAVVGVLTRDTIHSAPAGTLRVGSDRPVERESLFQIGSITKLFTAVLALQLVEAGKIGLDQPLRTVIPDLRVGSEAAGNITLRQLLTHTSGIDGDVFIEYPAGPKRLAEYVASLASVRQLHAPGARVSYCNAGFMIAGRLVEILSGESWDAALRRRILDPLEIAGESGEDDIVPARSRATGHYFDAKDPGALKIQLARYALPQSCAPAGTTLTMDVGGLLRFAHTLMRGGASSTGARLLSEGMVSAMLSQQVQLPPYAFSRATGIGLGPLIYQWNGGQLWGHDGDSVGFQAFLRVHAPTNTAIALLTNGGRTWDLANEIFARVMAPLCDLDLPPLAPPDLNLGYQPEPYEGEYVRQGRSTMVERSKEGLHLRIVEKDAEADAAPILHLLPVEKHVFRIQFPHQDTPGYLVFGDFDSSGRARTVFSGYRLSIRTDRGA